MAHGAGAGAKHGTQHRVQKPNRESGAERVHLRSGPQRKRRVRFGVGGVCVTQTVPV